MKNTSAPSFLLNEAVLLHKSGAVHEAIRRYHQILDRDPANGDALRLLCIAYAELGRFEDAVKVLRKAVRRSPKIALLQSLLGETLQASGRPDEALQCFNRALILQPCFVEALASRGTALAALNRHAEAVASFDRALAEKPDFIEVYMNRANSLRLLKRFDEALKSCDIAIQERPNMAEAHFNRGFILEDQGQFSAAVESFDRALPLAQPGTPWLGQLHGHRATSNHHLGNIVAASADIRRAIELSPHDDEIIFVASMMELLHGRWRDAWPMFEHRLRLANDRSTAASDIPPTYPMWSGEPLTDEMLVLKGEFGIGDQIQFCCFAMDLARRGFRIGLLVKPEMLELLKTVPGVERVFSSINQIKGQKFWWQHMISLPRILGTTVETLPRVVPFLSADPQRVARWRSWLGTDGFKIGIIWQGNPNYRMDQYRSIALHEYAPIAAIPGVRLVSLQKSAGSEQIAQVPFASKIETPDTTFDTAGTFVDTAAIMMNLDLVVTSDTAAAHLAGALGRPVFIALPKIPDWRWLLGREDSPWYPSARLFRQTRDRDWVDVFTQIANAIYELPK